MSRSKKSLNFEERIINFVQIHRDWVILGIFILLSLWLWWPSKNMPYHWDSAGYVINAAKEFLKTDFKPLVPKSVKLQFAHPPLFTATLALMWKYFGDAKIVSHFLTLPFLPMMMWAVYKIGEKLGSWKSGLIAAIATALTPTVLAEFGLIYLDLPMASLMLTAIWLWMEKKYILGSIILSLAVWIKIPAILALSFLGWIYLKNKKLWQNKDVVTAGVIPVFALLIWLTYHKSITGWLLIKPERLNAMSKDFGRLINSAIYIGEKIFLDQGRWIISLLGIGSVIYLKSKNKLKKLLSQNLVALLLFILIGFLFFVYGGEFGSRYAIFLLGPIYLICFFLFSKVVKKGIVLWILGFVTIGLLVLNWRPKTGFTENYEFAPPDDLSYRDMITIGSQAAKFLEINYKNAKIYGEWPENYQLEQPYQGYVKEALDFSKCQFFQLDTKVEQVLYLHAYAPGQMYCRQLLDLFSTEPINRFESGTKWLELYLVTSTASALIK
jgi:hypothetical protein